MTNSGKTTKGKKKNRPFQSDWSIHYAVVFHDNQRVFCCICKEVVTGRTYNIKRHYNTIHPEFDLLSDSDKFEKNRTCVEEHEKQKNRLGIFFQPNMALSGASFQISHVIASCGKALCDGEYIKNAMLKCSNILFDDFPNKDEILSRIASVPLSRNTVKDRILAIEEDVTNMLLQDLKSSKMFSICLDESTDITSQSRLAVFVRFSSETLMKEELLKLILLSDTCRGQDIMDEVSKEFERLGVDLQNLVSVTTDGAPSMVGKNIGFVKLLKQKIGRELISFHCIIHQEALCAKSTFKIFDQVLLTVTKIVNYISSYGINKRQFTNLLKTLESQYMGLIMYNNVRWLSRGNVLNRFVELLSEITCFLESKDAIYADLYDPLWLHDLHFFADFSNHFNNLNKKLQGSGQIVTSMFENIRAFEGKHMVFIRDLKERSLKYFPLLKSIQGAYILNNNDEENLYMKYISIMEDSQNELSKRFTQFRSLNSTLIFLQHPHMSNFEDLDLIKFAFLNLENLEMELIDFKANSLWKNKFILMNQKLQDLETDTLKNNISETNLKENVILNEWRSLPESFATMKKLALALLTIFGSTYSCETLFSSMNMIKSNKRNRLGNDISSACIKLKMTKYVPRFDKLSKDHQQQKSH
ncbi:General transcription factor II-I repeat domain-containing protein 2B [Dictyocoela muelleri]|nr:General transcription factor II-I repeat domain-containing protein 2B [Dictyocoela muelleri]